MKRLLLSIALLTLMSANGQSNNLNFSREKLNTMVLEVYGADFVHDNPTILDAMFTMVNDRIHFKELIQTTNEKYPLLSSFPAMNKLNIEVVPFSVEDFSFDTFNPFKYQVNYFSNQQQIIRLDNTSWVMIVDAQKK